MTTTTETRAQLEQMGTKADALAKIKEAEIAIAAAAASVFQAVKSGEVEPCSCLFGDLGMAQKQMEDIKGHLDGHGQKKQSESTDARSMVMEALMRAASS